MSRTLHSSPEESAAGEVRHLFSSVDFFFCRNDGTPTNRSNRPNRSRLVCRTNLAQQQHLRRVLFASSNGHLLLHVLQTTCCETLWSCRFLYPPQVTKLAAGLVDKLRPKFVEPRDSSVVDDSPSEALASTAVLLRASTSLPNSVCVLPHVHEKIMFSAAARLWNTEFQATAALFSCPERQKTVDAGQLLLF